ncbi:Sec-independent protein translocase TatB [Rothia endophytica]|uniref:Twin-arginine translocase TatA/TatE family subunit n=1 Tax=Rothia endophytica TaxID=1324766 RepID=A0ABP9B9G1_9MICC|nr:sec-independent translocase [Mycobacteroides abscessus subsp. bolletii]
MFGISGLEFIVLAILVFVVIGPERMPEYAQQLKDFVKQIRRIAFDAKDDLKETLGPDLGDINWRQYDPRQYDPRVIVREAFAEDEEERRKELEARAQAAPAASVTSRLPRGAWAPFDSEAT